MENWLVVFESMCHFASRKPLLSVLYWPDRAQYEKNGTNCLGEEALVAVLAAFGEALRQVFCDVPA